MQHGSENRKCYAIGSETLQLTSDLESKEEISSKDFGPISIGSHPKRKAHTKDK